MAGEPFAHLSKRARELMGGTIEERVAHVRREMWLPYPEGDHAIKIIQRVIDHERIARMPCVLVVALSNNGKSRILDRVASKNPHKTDERGNQLEVPVLLVSAPPSGDEDEFFERIVTAFGAPFNPGDRAKMLRYQAMTLLAEYKVKALLIDEFNLIGRGTANAQGKFLSRIRLMSADLQMGIVGAGVRESINFLNMDPQFATRFSVAPLPKWEKEKRTRDLLASLQRDFPLPELSGIDKGPFLDRLLLESEGTIGGLIELPKRLAEYAVMNREPKMTLAMVDQVDYIRPSQRVIEANRRLDGKKKKKKD